MAATATQIARYTGIQPQYFPRLHYFNRILNTDVFMIRDDAQYVKSHKYPDGQRGPSFQAHSPIKTSSGLYLLNLPVEHDGLKPIYQTRLGADGSWRQQHLKTIFFAYSRAPQFESVYSQLESIIMADHKSLSDLNIAGTLWVLGLLAGLTQTFDSSLTPAALSNFLSHQADFRLKSIKLGSQSRFYKQNPNATANEKVIGLCQEVGATEDYCGGTAKQAYMDSGYFKRSGVKITEQNWTCTEYPQQFVKNHGFLPNLSIIDLLMNVPLEQARSIVRD